ncbi:ribonuclease T2 [Phanerochaete sordida]|uniref:ribonuclease T2 n=1 Tax=Phanerochaete sordida TaxID=48140 RepID=A0A9P3L8A4_9APHY|nr:ribonuclease T2 [Phanerochaete sordida]
MSKFAALAGLLAVPALAQGLSSLVKLPNTFPNLTACLEQPSFFSCENTTVIENTCCSPTPGGLVLSTQFWDTYTGLEHQGQLLPKNSWTLHGLWPDNCDGSYASYCDYSRQYDPSPGKQPDGSVIPPYKGPSVATFIAEFGRLDLLNFMNKYWINQGGPNDVFWAHEFSKHATCTSTFDVACYGPDYKKHQDLVDFYDAAIRAYKQYPTFDMLATFGIIPSNKTTYKLSQFQNALKSQTGALPYLGCGNNGTVLQEVWYFQHVWGTEQFGHYKNLDSVTNSTCSPTAGIWYHERTSTSERDVRLLP